MLRKTKIDLRFVQLNSTFVWPLYSQSGEIVLDSRIPLTKHQLKDIQARYGNVVYYISEHDPSSSVSLDYSDVLAQAGAVLDEVVQTRSVSIETFKKTDAVVASLMDELNNRNTQIVSLVTELQESDDYIKQHLVNVSILSYLFAKKRNRYLPKEIKNIMLGAFLLDIGLVKLDDKVRNKSDAFEASDRMLMKRHPQLGYEMLKGLGIDQSILQTVLFHHEKVNGKGYYELPYEVLPDCVKMISICDVYDALTNDRPFRPAISPQHAMKMLVNMVGSHFEHQDVSIFINKVAPQITGTHTIYQLGDLCELITGELAIIIKIGIHDVLEPSVRILGRFVKDTSGKARLSFASSTIDVNLENDPTRMIRRFIINPKQVQSLEKILQEKKYI